MKNLNFSRFTYLIIAFVVIFAAFTLFPHEKRPEKDYALLVRSIQVDNIEKLIINITNNETTVKFKNNPFGDSADKEYKVYIPDITSFMNEVTPKIKTDKIKIVTVNVPSSPAWWMSIIPTLAVIVIFILFWVFFIQPAQGGGGNRVISFGKSRAKMTVDDKKKVTFNDVAGADEEKEELEEIVEFLKHPKKFIELGARIPKGVLLVGPPGTGKTLLARAVSGEAGVPFFSISGSDFVEMFVGVGASRVRDLFEQAKKNSPSIVFIDEIDAVGRHRGAGLGGGHDEREQTLNQLLVEMDGFGVNEGVIILAATNRPDILDPALLRPGRFDRRVVVGLPDLKGREEILKVHSRKKPLSAEVNLKDLAKSTPGFTGADLENLLNEAALLTARKSKKQIEPEEIKEATFKVIMGPEKRSKVLSEKEKKITAYHEAGHAIAVREVSTTDKVDRISIIPSGMAGGYTSFKPDEDKRYHTKSQLIESIMIALGGRAAEEIVLGEIDTGAYNDLKRANSVARNMITKYGMSEQLSNLVLGNDNDEIFIGRDFAQARNYSEEIAAIIDREVKQIIDSSYSKITDILKENIEKLHTVAKALMEKEKLEGHEFEELYNVV